jgi:hypothetical protein
MGYVALHNELVMLAHPLTIIIITYVIVIGDGLVLELNDDQMYLAQHIMEIVCMITTYVQE